MLVTTRQTDFNEEKVLCYFSAMLTVQFTHTKQGNMHTFERTHHQLTYTYPLHLSDHNAMVDTTFSKSYTANNEELIYKAIAKDYNKLLQQAYQAIEK